MGGGGSNPIFAHGKNVGKVFISHGKKEGKVFISLSFHILFSPFFPMGKMGKDTIFPWAKMGLDAPFLPMEKCVFPFFPMGKNGKKVYGKEGKSIHFPLFPYTFSPWEKMGKHTFFHGQK